MDKIIIFQQLKDIFEFIYYIAFIVLTLLIVRYSIKTYKLEAERHYELLCSFIIDKYTSNGSDLGYALEVFNAGNKVAKNVEVIIDEETVTTINYIKPNDSFCFPLGMLIQGLDINIPFSELHLSLNKGNSVAVILRADGNEWTYNVNTDLLFATRIGDKGSLRGVMNKLEGIEKAIKMKK